MIKKLCKWLGILAVACVLLLVAAVITLKMMYPPEKLKALAQAYVATNFHRQIDFEDISLTWIGFTLKNFTLSEESTLQDGTFIKAGTLTAHVAVKPLLQKRVEISTIEADGLALEIIQRPDGTFNFDSLLTPTGPEEETASEDPSASSENSFAVTAEKIVLNACDIVYQNQQNGLRLALNDLNIQIDRFDLVDPFTTHISFTADISGTGQPDMKIPVTLAFQTALANLDLPRAYATLTQAQARYKTVTFDLQGDVKNFETPAVELTGSLSGINNRVLADIAPGLPEFSLPVLKLSLKAAADIPASTAQISEAKLAVQNSSLSAGGNVGWGGTTPTYNLKGNLRANLAELVQMAPSSANGFEPGGVVTGTFNASERKNYTDVSGQVTLQNVRALYEPFTLSALNGTVAITSIDQISSSNLTGKLNDQKFSASFAYKNIQDVMNLVFALDLDRLVLDKFPASAATQAQTSAPADAGSSATGPSPRMNIRADVRIGGVQIPYVQSEGFTLSANLTDVTDTLSQVNGKLSFVLQPGKITNLDDFIKDSKIAKIMLLPLAVVKKVAGFLGVNLFPTDSQTGTAISFTKGTGDYTFTNGEMKIEETSFVSSVTTLSAMGTTNFATDTLNMKATATLLTQAAPVVIKITGTLSDPKGKLDVVNTVGAVVGGLLNGTAVKSAAKGGTNLTKGAAKTGADAVEGTVETAVNVVKGIGNLFKKKPQNSNE